MPTYAYRCPNCGHEFEKFQKITNRTRPRCPKCKTKAERVITGGAGVLFKGSGFYETDYKRAGKTEKGEKADKAGKADKPDKKDNTKPRPGAKGSDS
jgi:putative FmdB family regulatory protein